MAFSRVRRLYSATDERVDPVKYLTLAVSLHNYVIIWPSSLVGHMMMMMMTTTMMDSDNDDDDEVN